MQLIEPERARGLSPLLKLLKVATVNNLFLQAALKSHSARTACAIAF